jgi:hypothetical protein
MVYRHLGCNMRKVEKKRKKKHWVTTLVESGSRQNAGLMNTISPPKKTWQPMKQGHKQAVKRLKLFFSLWGEGGRVKIQVLMKAVGGGGRRVSICGVALLFCLFFGALHQCATRAFSFCRHLFSNGIYVPLFLASRMLPCLALPCPALPSTALH